MTDLAVLITRPMSHGRRKRGDHKIHSQRLAAAIKIKKWASHRDFSAIFLLVGFLLRGNCRNQYVSTRIHVSLFCILLDLYFMSEMRSRSVSNQKEYCTKSVHVRILYIIRVNLRNQYICTHFLISRFLNFILNLHLWIFWLIPRNENPQDQFWIKK